MSPEAESKETQSSVFQIFKTFLKLGCTSFGGPIAHLGYFRKELVENQKWVTEGQYSQLLAICQFLPGPASSQVGFSLGLIRGSWLGALAAFTAFTLPSAILLVLFASILPMLEGPYAQAIIHGLKIVAFAVVADAVFSMFGKLCTDIVRRGIAVFVAGALILAGTATLQLLLVAFGALAGIAFCRSAPSDSIEQLPIKHSLKSGYIFLACFTGLLLILPILGSGEPTLISIADSFYRAGALVFGGGHVVLPLLEDAVVTNGWLAQDEFLAGYGASQAIPGPMFAFAAYLGGLIPIGQNALLGALIALLFIFLPGFLLVAGVLPVWKTISGNKTAANAVAGINAAVVGLLAAALYDPILTSAIIGYTDLAIGAVGFLMLRWWGVSPLVVVAWCTLSNLLIAIF